MSSEHASVHWVHGRWELRDLGSRNGTFLEGRRLARGERVELRKNAIFTLSSSGPAYQLVDAEPPGAAALQKRTGARRTASGGMLLLPDEELPLVSVFEDNTGRWVIEAEGEVLPVVDQQIIDVAGTPWILELPPSDSGTWQSSGNHLIIENLHLHLAVSQDEEHVQAKVIMGREEHELSPRSHHYMLVTLARARLADQSLPEAKQGWVDRENLCRMLATDLNKLNVDLHRARKQFAELGIQNAAALVERRPGTGELRLGIRHVEVGRL